MTTSPNPPTAPGQARSSGPSVQDLLDRDTKPVPGVLREESYVYLGSDDIDRQRYVSRDFHDREVDKVWRKVWQVACREEEIPDVGDTVVYDIADDSLIVVRVSPTEIKAFYNSCLHRGRTLRDADGNVPELRCPFHGFCWKLDGSLKEIPCEWDFPHVDPATFRLPEAAVGTWGGFVFINMDPECQPLEEYLGDLPRHFERWALDKRYKIAHVARVMRANWKVTLEAFIESFHVITTHPQILTTLGDANTEYDVYKDQPHFNRMISAQGIPSPHLGPDVPEQVVLDSMLETASYYENMAAADPRRRVSPDVRVQVPEGGTAREVLAAMMRADQDPLAPDVSEASDSEILDAIQYTLFPNLFPWGGAKTTICYRFRPNGNNPDTSIMECMLLAPLADGAERPAPAKIHWLEPDEDWLNAPELGILAAIFDQDSENLSRVQRGLRASRKQGVTLGNYQEVRVRHFNQTLDEYLAR